MLPGAHTRFPGSAPIVLVRSSQLPGQQAPLSPFVGMGAAAGVPTVPTVLATAVSDTPGSWLRVDATDLSTVHTDESCPLPYSYPAVWWASACVLAGDAGPELTHMVTASKDGVASSNVPPPVEGDTGLPHILELLRYAEGSGAAVEDTQAGRQAAAEPQGRRTLLESFGTALGITAFLFAGLPTWLLYV
jgi:hypothetical protein